MYWDEDNPLSIYDDEYLYFCFRNALDPHNRVSQESYRDVLASDGEAR